MSAATLCGKQQQGCRRVTSLSIPTADSFFRGIVKKKIHASYRVVSFCKNCQIENEFVFVSFYKNFFFPPETSTAKKNLQIDRDLASYSLASVRFENKFPAGPGRTWAHKHATGFATVRKLLQLHGLHTTTTARQTQNPSLFLCNL